VTAAAEGYSFGAVAQILGVSESKLRYWSQIGFVGPSRRNGARQMYTFQDLVSVRAAKELIERGFPTAAIRRALESVRASLPQVDRPLDRLRVAFDGDGLVLLDDGAAFEVTGQRVFAFGLAELAARASAAVDATAIAPPERSAYEWFLEGVRAEEQGRDDDAAACYRSALAADPGLAAAHTNLGSLAHRRGDEAAARASFETALGFDPDQPEARYNLETLLFETGEIELAAAELRRVVAVAPHFADGHYNLATALERLGSKWQAREHLEGYLALAGGDEHAAWVGEPRARLARL
jgi:DNA-binding transcriptional MerR regulator